MLTSLRAIMILLGVGFFGILAYDISLVVNGAVDVNQHMPFFIPIVFLILMAICIRIDRGVSRDRDNEPPDTLN